MTQVSELDRVQERYARRAAAGLSSIYDPVLPVNVCFRQERELATLSLIRGWLDGRHMSDLSVLEVGCGSGNNLLQMISWGVDPGHIVANELLPERLKAARHRLPAAVRVVGGDAAAMDSSLTAFDLILQVTVFSSIIDEDTRRGIARRMWSSLKEGGAILWYDFTYDNPNNPDVKGVRVREIRELFPDAEFRMKRITLAPPLARRVAPISRHAYNFFASLGFINTHIVALLVKPSR